MSGSYGMPGVACSLWRLATRQHPCDGKAGQPQAPALPEPLLAACFLGPLCSAVAVAALLYVASSWVPRLAAVFGCIPLVGLTALAVAIQRKRSRRCARGEPESDQQHQQQWRHPRAIETAAAAAAAVVESQEWPPQRRKHHQQQWRRDPVAHARRQSGSVAGTAYAPSPAACDMRKASGTHVEARTSHLPRASFDKALRAVKESGLSSYIAFPASAHVYIRVAGMQPEQLSTGWLEDLERRFADQGWCVVNAAVRPGSTCISMTLGNVRSRRDAAAAAADAAADATQAPERASNGPAQCERHTTDANPDLGSDSDSDSNHNADKLADLVGGPAELLAGLGVRCEDLSPGFSFTVHVLSDDGQSRRMRYTYQEDGTWRSELLAASAAAGGTGASVTASTASDPRTGSDGGSSAKPPSNRPTIVHSLGLGGCASASGSDQDRAGSKGLGSAATSAAAAAPRWAQPPLRGSSGGSGRSRGGAGAAAAWLWTLRAPHILFGVPEDVAQSGDSGPQVAQRYEAEVWVGITARQESGRCSNGKGDDGSGDSSGEEPISADPWGGADLVFRVRQLGFPCAAPEFRVEQVALQYGAEMTTCGSEPRSGFGRATGLRSPSIESFAMGGSRGRTWRLTVWSDCSQAVADSPALGLPPGPQHCCYGGGSAGEAGGGGTSRCAGAPRLVDLSVWRGEELLTARSLLLVPTHGSVVTSGDAGCDTGSSACVTAAPPQWASQLQALLCLNPADVAQHILVDLGLLVSGAFVNLAQPLPPPTAAAESPTQSTAQECLLGGGVSRLEERLQPGGGEYVGGSLGLLQQQRSRQLVLLLDLGTNLVSLALRRGYCALAEQLWVSLERLGFGAEEMLLHGGGGVPGSLPLLPAATTSGQPAAVALVLSWYDTAGLPEPWLQPVMLPGSSAVVTPLAIASAVTAPSGALLSYTLRNHPRSLAAWRVRVGGTSARSVAAAAGLWAVALEADMRAAIVPAAAAVAARVRQWLRRLLGHRWLAAAALRWRRAAGPRPVEEGAGRGGR